MSAGNGDAAESATNARIAALEEEIKRLQRTNQVLMDRVEKRINQEGSAFTAFQAASKLEKTVDQRTAELRILNERLEHELQMRRNFEGALLRAKQQAEEATASRTRFVAAASHDLRQPLNAAVLYLQAIDQQQMRSADQESIRGIAMALDTLDSLLGALLDISRLDSGGLHPQPSHFRLQHLLSRLAGEYGSIAAAADLALQIDPHDAVVHTDMMLLETVLRNLLSNAIKYTTSGQITVRLRPQEHNIGIEVSDTGIGIDAGYLQKIFTEFWRAPGTPASDEGSMGLGLAIVQRICQLLGTEIKVQSELGKGSTFGLTIGLGNPQLVTDPAGDNQRQVVVGFHGCPIAVVDDNAQVLRSMVRLLEDWDCRVIAAATVEELLTTLIDLDITPRLLMADYHLADGATGIDAITAINAEIATPAPAIMISSDNSRKLRQQLQTLDIPLLTKPVEAARLRALMQHLLATT